MAAPWLCVIVLLGFESAPVSAAETTYEYDPALSLTGSCLNTTVDHVPDPGCPEGPQPPAPFSQPKSVAIDTWGDEYVASYGSSGEGSKGRIDIFSPSGHFLTELKDPFGPKSLAVDTEGNLYAYDQRPGFNSEIARYSPSAYEPKVGKIEYDGSRSVLFSDVNLPTNGGVAVDLANNHVFATNGLEILEFSSAKSGNEELDPITHERLFETNWLAVDASRNRLYASSCPREEEKCVVLVFEATSPHALVKEVDGSNLPAGRFVSNKGWTSMAVDEGTGHFFVDDLVASKNVYEFDEDYNYVSTITFNFDTTSPEQIGVSNAVGKPNSHYLFVPSGFSGVGHALAFKPASERSPKVTGIAAEGIGEHEADLHGTIDPEGGNTHYVVEYLTQGSYEEAGEDFAGGKIAAEGTVPAETQEAQLTAHLAGLLPGTAYRFRIRIENGVGKAEKEGAFSTYSDASVTQACSNQAYRIGYSTSLPDCRAYELVTPPDTNGRTPRGVGFYGDRFPTVEASPSGGTISFLTEGGSIPGIGGTGAFNGDLFRTTRGPSGWTTVSAGPTGPETNLPAPGSTSPDQGYAFWGATGTGSAVVSPEETKYVRYPDGHSELVGRGSLGTDPEAAGKRITEGGTHIIFQTQAFGKAVPIQLEPEAPPSGTQAVYDRTADEVTHVVSLLPGNETPEAGEDAVYVGASSNGNGIAFAIGKTLYLRVDDEVTYEIGENVTFAGVSKGGKRVFYLEGGDLFAFDTETEERIQFSATGNAVVVSVAPDGTRAYFLSTTAIAEAGENPDGALAKEGQENLYLSAEGAIRFVATVKGQDVERETPDGEVEGLGLWVEVQNTGRIGKATSRLNPDGSVMLFESSANLGGYDPGAYEEIYRYDSAANSLRCISCIPTKTPASGGASLESIAPGQDKPGPFSPFGFVPNLRADGRRAFFESTEALVSTDTDKVQDVYEWEEEDVGSCTRPGGCIYLISSGASGQKNYLYAVSASGDDLFFITGDVLAGDDEGTPSIYDARVNGGFPETVEEGCEGEGCRPALTPPPALLPAAKPAAGAQDNVGPKRCPRGKHEVRRHGKVRCVKKHRRHRHRGAAAKKGSGK